MSPYSGFKSAFLVQEDMILVDEGWSDGFVLVPTVNDLPVWIGTRRYGVDRAAREHTHPELYTTGLNGNLLEEEHPGSDSSAIPQGFREAVDALMRSMPPPPPTLDGPDPEPFI